MPYDNAASVNSSRHGFRDLEGSAYALRQHAIASGRDLEGWRLARRMRDAASLRELNSVQRDLGSYLTAHDVELPQVA